jgi:hypothetical protein
MNVLTCEQVEEQLDLLAGGECAWPTRRAVEQHLETCAACAASYEESRRLQSMLDLHWNEAEQLARLRRRINEADRQAERPRLLMMPWLRPAVALAAMLLVTFGLALLMPQMSAESPAVGLTAALAPMADDGITRENMKTQSLVAPAHPQEDVAMAKFDKQEKTLALAKGQSGQDYRRSLRGGRSPEDLPQPPSLPLELTLQNNAARRLEVRLGDDAQLALDVQGPEEGVLRLPAPKSEEAAFLPRQTLWLAPGERRTLRVERLVVGSRQHIEYVYLTEPGEYTLTIHLRALVDREPVWLTSEPLHIPVRAP